MSNVSPLFGIVGLSHKRSLWYYREGDGIEINERVEELAEEKGVTMAQIALAWHFHKDVVNASIVGTTSVEHLEQAVEALESNLSALSLLQR